MSYFSPESRSYFNSASHYSNQHGTSSYYSDMYRSFTNLRTQQPIFYQQPLYISTVPVSYIKKPTYDRFDSPRYDSSKRTSSTGRLGGRYGDNQTDSKSSITSSRYSSNANSFDDADNAAVNIPVSKKREGIFILYLGSFTFNVLFRKCWHN